MMTRKRRPGQSFDLVTNTPFARTAKEFDAAVTPQPAACFAGFQPNSGRTKPTMMRTSKWSNKTYQQLDLA